MRMKPANGVDFNVESMALYGLERARTTVDSLACKTFWSPDDTASFDCMHYLGDAAIDNCARAIAMKPGAHVLDIGSGFNATGRYLNRRLGAHVTGVELQRDIHAIAQTITARNGQSADVHSVNTNFLTAPATLIGNASVDHIVSFLCILHIPQRAKLFERAAQTVKPGGSLYIEDFYARHPLPVDEQAALRDIVSCPYLPDRNVYVADLENAGFVDVRFEDVSTVWCDFVSERAGAYHAKVERNASLDVFYTTVAELFQSGHLGGARLSAQRPDSI